MEIESRFYLRAMIAEIEGSAKRMEEGLEGDFISSNLEGNPFATLFPTIEVAVAYRESQVRLEEANTTELMVIETEQQLLPKDSISPISDENVKQTQDLNNIIEEVFLVTLNQYSVVGGAQQQLIHLSSLAEVGCKNISCYLILNQGGWSSYPAMARPAHP